MTTCCKTFEDVLASDEIGLGYFAKFREYGFLVRDGGTSHINISYCPWCGKKLPPVLREVWFERLEALGLEPGDRNIPEELRSDEWWRKDKL